MWIAIRRTATTASTKWSAVNRRNDQDVTVAEPKTNPTTSSPRIGSTVNKFKITRAAQQDIFPETTTYPVKAVPRDSRNSADPTIHNNNFDDETTFDHATALAKWMIVEMTTKFAPSMCNIRTSQTKLPWNMIEINSEYWTSRFQARSPSSKKPVSNCRIQNTRAKNAIL